MWRVSACWKSRFFFLLLSTHSLVFPVSETSFPAPPGQVYFFCSIFPFYFQLSPVRFSNFCTFSWPNVFSSQMLVKFSLFCNVSNYGVLCLLFWMSRSICCTFLSKPRHYFFQLCVICFWSKSHNHETTTALSCVGVCIMWVCVYANLKTVPLLHEGT